MSDKGFVEETTKEMVELMNEWKRQGALEVWNEVRRLMKPLPSNTKKEDLWIAGSFKTPEEFVLVNLRQKVLKKIDRIENELKKVECE